MNEVIFAIGMKLEELEKLAILKAIGHFRGNKMTTANSLGIDRRTLDHRLEKYAAQDKEEQKRKDYEEIRRHEQLARARGNPPNNLGLIYPGYSTDSRFLQNSGISNESSINFTPKSAMPLSERPQVQEVLSNHTSKGSKKK